MSVHRFSNMPVSPDMSNSASAGNPGFTGFTGLGSFDEASAHVCAAAATAAATAAAAAAVTSADFSDSDACKDKEKESTHNEFNSSYHSSLNGTHDENFSTSSIQLTSRTDFFGISVLLSSSAVCDVQYYTYNGIPYYYCHLKDNACNAVRTSSLLA